MAEKLSAKAELERMVALLNGWLPGRSQKLELKFKRRVDLDGVPDGVLAFLLLAEENSRFARPSAICWGGGYTADQACEMVIQKFAAGSDLFREYFPFIPCTAGSAAELELKLAAFGREGRPA